MDGTKREQIHPGSQVYIVLKKDQRSGTLTKGIVKDILTKSSVHHHVLFQTNQVKKGVS